jgi:glucose-fructose oxidoreductase
MNLAVMDLARSGQLGDLKYFTSSFSMTVRRGDIRTRRAFGGGTLYDIGVYCINAARNLFRAEPTEVSAVSVNSGVVALSEIDETTAATLRFGEGRVATFVTSFNAADVAALLYFSDCILSDRVPEPSGEEGLQDVRLVEALYLSARLGRPVKVPAFKKRKRPTGRQRITRPATRKPRLIKVQSASRD